jgi:hypothetical protein
MRGFRLAIPAICLLFAATENVHAQSDTAIAPVPDKTAASAAVDDITPVADTSLPVVHHRHTHFGVGMTYQSNDVYLGRKDSSALPYYIPSLSYFHKSGLFATASVSYLKNASASRVDLVTLDAGYMFSKGKYSGTFTFSKYFYNNLSTSVTSEIKASAAYYNSYDLGFIKPSFTATLNMGDKTDFATTLGLSHTFELIKDNLEISPAFNAEASTQDFYSDYYRNRKYQIKKKKVVVGTGEAAVTGTVLNASTFRVLDYEASMPIEYTIGKCTIGFTPTYTMPVHPATLAIHTVKDNGQVNDTIRSEKISNTFYFTVGVDFLF